MRIPFRLLQILVLLAGLCPGAAAAQTFSVPSPCGSRAEFDARLRELLAREDVPSPDSLVISESAGGYSLSMRFDGQQRELRDPNCRLLLRTAALMLAAHTDPQLAAAAAPPPPAPTEQVDRNTPSPPQESTRKTAPVDAGDGASSAAPAVEDSPKAPAPDAVPPPASPAPPPSEPPPTTAPAPPPGLWLDLAAGGSGQEVPRFSPRVELGAELEIEPLSLLLAFHYTLPQRRERGDGFAVNVQAFGVRALAGYAVLPYLRLRLGPTAAYMTGEGTGGTPSKAGGGAVALGLAAELAPHLCASPALCGELALFGRYAALRPTFEVSGFGQVFRAPSWSGGVVLRLLVKIL